MPGYASFQVVFLDPQPELFGVLGKLQLPAERLVVEVHHAQFGCLTSSLVVGQVLAGAGASQ
jgi:hypothetical protein